jgi:hypothetical protein
MFAIGDANRGHEKTRRVTGGPESVIGDGQRQRYRCEYR